MFENQNKYQDYLSLALLKLLNENIFYDIRFHLYPKIQVIKTMSGENYLIQLSKNKSLLFSSDKISTKIEEGIYMGKNKILKKIRSRLILKKEKNKKKFKIINIFNE